ncbi:hypothetical protein [Longimicrobium sp.]|uniref:hypothetical protein n=1 Tax=Longimicrobium sp. TaxID=2029185 RepID=UPI002BD52284|nr:hypothetical protein [Longimicrobium sp.]HSU13437.1 hypothetical protein [Longimicrobium sp.]
MVSITHADIDELTDDEVRIPAGGRWMGMDWECVARAFDGAAEQLGWDVEIRLTPERQHALVLFPSGQVDLLAATTDAFYRLVEEQIGAERFMSIWIDFGSKRLYDV